MADSNRLAVEDAQICNNLLDSEGNVIKDASGTILLDCFVKDKQGNFVRDISGEYMRTYYVKDLTTGNYIKDSKGKYITNYYARDIFGNFIKDASGNYITTSDKNNTDKNNSDIFNTNSKSYMDRIISDRKMNSTISNLNMINNINNSNNKPIYAPFYQLNLLQMALELKDTWFSILDDILAGNMTLDVILKENRLFYVGFTILIIAIILYIYDYAINPNDPMQNLISGGNGVVEIRHVYEKRD